MPSGIAITLKYQHDYIEDSVLIYSCGNCTVYLVADGNVSPPSYVKLEFDRVQCVRSARTDCSPAIGIYPENPGVSFIVELTESKWPVEARELYVYADSPIKPRGRHFVITNHDIFHEVLAESFSESILQKGSPEYDFVKQYFS
mgnify:CR=1 FL=1